MSGRERQIPTQEQLSRVELLVLDVDGVMTDGRLHFDADGREAKVFHVRDGYGIKQLMALGVEVAVISGRDSTAVERRTKELNIKHTSFGQDNKLSALQEIAGALDIALENTACVGDDLPDLPLLEAAGLAIAVADAEPSLIAIADWCTELAGGQGCVREICDRLVMAKR